MHIQTYAHIGCFMVGMAAGYVLLEKTMSLKYEQIAQEEIDSVKAVYSTFDEPVEAPPIDEPCDPEPRVGKNNEERVFSSIQEHPNARDAFTSYRSSKASSLSGVVIQPDDENEELDDGEEETMRTPTFSNEDDDTSIHVISAEEFYESHDEYDKNTLTYYEGDVTLADDQDVPIDDYTGIIGENNLRFGVLSQDPNIVYIRNPHLHSDYEVLLDQRTYLEIVSGLPPDQVEV